MAKNTIIMIGDGMGWEMTRAAAVYKQIQDGKTGTSLSDFYTAGKGTGLNMQTLTGYTLATTYGTTIPNASGIYGTGNAAVTGSSSVTGVSPATPGFVFNPTFNPGNTPTGGAKVSDGVVGNLVVYDPVRGGINPWTPGTDKEYTHILHQYITTDFHQSQNMRKRACNNIDENSEYHSPIRPVNTVHVVRADAQPLSET